MTVLISGLFSNDVTDTINKHIVWNSFNLETDNSIKPFSDNTKKFISTQDSRAISTSPRPKIINDFTIEFWIYFNGTPSGGISNIENNLGWAITFIGNRILLINDRGNIIDNNFTIPINKWIHFAFVRNGNSFFVYMDGNQIILSTNTVVMNDTAHSLNVGYGYGVSGGNYIIHNKLTGNVAQFKLSDEALYNVNFIPEYILPCKKFLIKTDNKFYSTIGDPSVSAIPKMTSNTAPSGVVSSSEIKQTGREAFRAFDGVEGSSGWSAKLTIGWIQYKFSKEKVITRYSMVNYHGFPNATPRDWIFEGSNDGVNWTTLDERKDEDSADKVWREYEFVNIKRYAYYRLNVSKNNGGVDLTISEMKMYENTSLLSLSNDSINEDNYIRYGLDKYDIIDLNSKMVSITNVESNNEILGDGKVFKCKIDTSKTTIKGVDVK